MDYKSFICIIPARLGSTRLPRKPLAEINGRPLVMWVVDAALKSEAFDGVHVATDSEEIIKAVEKNGGKAILTASTHERGTDRVFEAAQRLTHDFVVNLQGDEPAILPTLLRSFADMLTNRIDDNSLLTCITNATIEGKSNRNTVKAVVSATGEALYFSRAPVPYDYDNTQKSFFQHIGIYGFSRESLARFCSFKQGTLECLERLEQLRALENGMKVICMPVEYRGFGIDTPEDLERFRALQGKPIK
jgi:3-deoxy-D-manno-octulosonate cytidylyltransferase